MRSQTFVVLTFCAALAGPLTGCAELHHNDVLIFGTETKLALDVSAPPTSAGIPSVTIGYKRQEAVWMPLLVNGQQSKLIPGPASGDAGGDAELDSAKYRSKATYMPKGGSSIVQEDAYSVFASFGAKLSGEAQAGTPRAAAGLAQFFATGNAAINISQNEALVTALKIESAGGAQAQAQAVQAAATADPAAVTAGRTEAKGVLTRVGLVMACAQPDTGWRWPTIVEGMSASDPDILTELKTLSADELRRRLTIDEALTTQALEAGATKFNCPKEPTNG